VGTLVFFVWSHRRKWKIRLCGLFAQSLTVKENEIDENKNNVKVLILDLNRPCRLMVPRPLKTARPGSPRSVLGNSYWMMAGWVFAVVVDVHLDVRLAVIQESGAALATPVFNFCQMSNFSTFNRLSVICQHRRFVGTCFPAVGPAGRGGMRRIGQTVRRRPPPPL
jgi:hypothetical protein